MVKLIFPLLRQEGSEPPSIVTLSFDTSTMADRGWYDFLIIILEEPGVLHLRHEINSERLRYARRFLRKHTTPPSFHSGTPSR